MPLWHPFPSVFQNPDHLGANLTTVCAPLRSASILAECLLRFLTEFTVTGLGRFRHAVFQVSTDVAQAAIKRSYYWIG